MNLQTATKVALDLADPSTYAGLGIMASVTGAHLPPGYATGAQVLAGLFGVLSMFLVRRTGVDPATVVNPVPEVTALVQVAKAAVAQAQTAAVSAQVAAAAAKSAAPAPAPAAAQ